MSNLHITKQQSNKLEGKKKYQPSNKEAIENQLENVKHLIEEESMKPLIEQQTNRLEGPDMKTENVGMDPKEADTDYSGADPFSEDNNKSKKEVASNAFSIFNETNKKDESEARSEFSIGTEVINVDYLTSTDNSETTTSILEAAHDEEVPKKLFYDVPPKTPVSKSSKSVLEIGKSYR